MNLLIEKYKKYEPFFGNWYIKSLLGEGAFGAVFEIEREDFGIKYSSALKIVSIPQSESELEYIKDEGMDEDATSKYYEDILMRMMNEFALMSKMRGHSNIVSYEDHQIIPHEGSIGWDILIRMELLTPIRKWQENHPMTEKDVIELGIDICDALEVCKKYNIIHRDIKPENIFVSSSDNYKLGDFGIARTMENTRGASTKAGTGRYMAPEVYRGERYNDTVDIYSLGLVLYRYLNDNRAPFLPPYPQPIKFSDQEMAQEKRLNGERLPKATHASDGIMDVINKACQFKPNDRYHSASEMKKDLLSLQSTIGVTAETVNNNDNTSSESNICEVKNTEKSARESKDAENNTIIRDNESIEVRKEDTYEKESEPVSLPIEDENDLTEVVSNEEKTVGYFTDVPTKNNLNDEKSDKAKSKKLQIVLATIFLLVAMFFAYTRLFGMGFVADKNALLPETDLINQIAVGDVISFGSYKGNPISWYVVDKKDGEAMLLCVNALEECRYHNSRKDIVWNESDIRQWLNGEFYNESFDDEEKTRIKTYESDRDRKVISDGKGNEWIQYFDICDMVTLLSGEEVEEFRDYANCDFDYWIRGEGEELGNAKYYNVRLEEIGDYTPMRMNTYVRPVIRIGYKSADIEYINPIDIESLSLGDIVTYGKYNGEPINWYVVNIVGNNATLLCVDTMEAQPYNNEQLVVTWGGSTLRTWLNEVFYNEAFSVSEKMWIMPSETRTYEHIKGKGFLRQVAFDKVYILSKDDAFKYTEYLACNHSWWLRDHGNTDNDALFVHDFGKINNDGMEVSAVNIGVRPVITICN